VDYRKSSLDKREFFKTRREKKEAPKEAKSLSCIQRKLGTVRRRTGGLLSRRVGGGGMAGAV
jgi:hypothetical protein